MEKIDTDYKRPNDELVSTRRNYVVSYLYSRNIRSKLDVCLL